MSVQREKHITPQQRTLRTAATSYPYHIYGFPPITIVSFSAVIAIARGERPPARSILPIMREKSNNMDRFAI